MVEPRGEGDEGEGVPETGQPSPGQVYTALGPRRRPFLGRTRTDP